jgi:FkbM family methyltransferase
MGDSFISYAQNGEDIVLWRAFKSMGTTGTYVDVGAADPVEYSVTRAFYERGWRGVNVEPVAAFADALRRNRPGDVVVECVAGSFDGTASIHVAEGTGLSTVRTDVAALGTQHGHLFVSVEVKAQRLDTILEAAALGGGPIHFLKVDVEGAEGEVLAGTDLARWKPWVVVVEATEPLGQRQTHANWESTLLEAGYHFCLFDGLNRFYGSSDHPELWESLSYPVCVFDQPFQRAEASLAVERSRGETAALLARTSNELAVSRADCNRLRSEVRGLDERLTQTLAKQVAGAQHVRHLVSRLDKSVNENLHLIAAVDGLTEVVRNHEFLSRKAELERDSYHQRVIDANEQLAAIRSELPFRVATRLFGRRRRVGESLAVAREVIVDISAPDEEPTWLASTHDEAEVLRKAFAVRVAQAAAVLRNVAFDDSITVDGVQMGEFEDACASATCDPGAVAWLALVAADGRYPTEAMVRRLTRRFRLFGPSALGDAMAERFTTAIREQRPATGDLDVRTDLVVVDVTHTAAHDLHTGIQRVVREACSRWLVDASVVPIHWNRDSGSVRALALEERDRLIHWKLHAHGAASEQSVRAVREQSGRTLVPWRCRLLIPELAAEPDRCDAYRGMLVANVTRGFSALVYDLIPISASETVAAGMPGAFADYLSMIKYADRLSAISESSARDYQGFADGLASQGIAGPEIAAHLLPAGDPEFAAADVEDLETDLELFDDPLVLVVGSHEPRKNHLLVLEAAESLWRSGENFLLVFMGGSGWRAEEFDQEVLRLSAAGFAVSVRKRVTEAQLWAAYATAKFSVFPSLTEGFGLPVVESLRSGTPVITSNYGAMAELERGGGVVLVDPRNATDLAGAMKILLSDPATLDRLRVEARARVWVGWDAYATAVWSHLVPETTTAKKGTT